MDPWNWGICDTPIKERVEGSIADAKAVLRRLAKQDKERGVSYSYTLVEVIEVREETIYAR